MNNKILIVDDSQTDITIIKNILKEYSLLCAYDGLEAMEILKREPDIDIMILDLNMPKMDGFQVLEEVHKDPALKKIAILILTNYDETENEVRGLDLGALDYIRKPLNMESLIKRIEVHIHLRDARRELEQNNLMLEKIVEERTQELIVTRDITIHALVGLLEVRNIESSNHTRRTQWMIRTLCDHLRKKELFFDILTDSYIREIFNTAPLHDIGKVGIPDIILLKPGKLTHEEFEIMKKHTTFGVDALKYNQGVTNTVSFIKTAIEIVGSHHEKYDGSGYPDGLKGEEIPLPARLMAIVDVYDALISKRVYKPPYLHENAMKIIMDERGKHFDPVLVDAFWEIGHQLEDIASRYVQSDYAGE